MNAALLCPGPSLLRTFTRETAGTREAAAGYSLVLGVNRAPIIAAAVARCDWWVCQDWTLVEAIGREVRGRPKLCTARRTLERIAEGKATAGDVEAGCTIEDLWASAGAAWNRLGTYTAPWGLVLAEREGATQIDVYGADWTDAPDADGVWVEGCRRDAERWRQEGACWGEACRLLAERGVGVRLVLAGATCR